MTPHLESQVEAPVEDKGKQNAKAERHDAHSVSLRQLYQVGLTRTLLVCFLLLSLLPLTIVSGIAYLQSEQALRTSTLKALTQRTDLQATFISNWFSYRFRDLRAQAEDDSNAVFLRELKTGFKNSGQPLEQFVGGYRWETIVASHKNHLHSLSQVYDYYYDIFLLDLQGNILFSVTRESDLGTNLFTGPYKETLFASTVKQSLTTGESLFSDLERYAPSNNVIAGFLAAPIIDKNGDKMGVYAVQIEVDRINEEVSYQSRSSDHNSEHSYLIGEDLRLRSAYPSHSVLENSIDTEQSQRWKQEQKQTSEENDSTDEVFEYVGPAGQNVLGVLHTLTLNNIRWGLISEIDEVQAFAPARELAWLTFALVALVVVLVILFAIWLAQRFVSPLSHLLHIVDAATQGKLDHHVDLKLENEIGQLGDAFNEMLAARQGYEIELNEQHQQMERTLDELAEQRFALDQHAIVSTTDLAGTITLVNEKFKEVSGYSAEESIGQNHRIINSGHHPKEFFKEMYQIICSGAVWKGEICNRAKGGLLYWVDSTIVPIMDTNHKPKGYIAIRTDITSRKLSEEKELWHNQATRVKFRVMEALSKQIPLEERLDLAIDEILLLKGLKLQGKAGVFILNEDSDELSLSALRGDFGGPFIRDEIKRPLDFRSLGHAIDSGDVIVRAHCIEQHRHDHNPNTTPHGHYVIPLRSASLQGDTQTTGVLFLYTDPDPIADDQRMSLLREIGTLFSNSIMRHSVIKRYQTATLEAQTASVAKSEFLANMSHEIRTPMNGVLGMLKLLQASELSAKQCHQANLARSSAEALLSLINDILDFSKIEAEKLELENIDFNIRQMIGDMSESMALQAQEKGLELILDLSAITLSHVKGDPGRLRQLMVNIVGNAIKFTEHGEIIICLGLRGADEHGMILYGSVTDTGMGIPQEKLETLFDSFSQVDTSTTRHFGGTGLGLSICKSLSELMGGGLTVGSTLGEGSRFEFTLTMQHSEFSNTVEPTVDMTNRRILVVDDNTSNREVLCQQLHIWGADACAAKDASHALTIMEQQLDRPFSVVFIDMQMPGIAGPALGQAIRSEPSYDETRLVMMTPMGELGDSNFFTSLGFDGYFPKPTTTADLCDALAKVLGNSGGATQTNSQTNSSKSTSKEPFRILLVEDNEINREVALGVLGILGYDADVAHHGLDAIGMLSNAPEDTPYSIILMDCQMPEMDGYTATEEIRAGTAGERYQQISIVAMTANAMLGDKEKCLDAGMDDYLSKPLDPDKLEAILHLYQEKYAAGKVTEGRKENKKATGPKEPEKRNNNSAGDNAIATWDKADVLQRVRGKEKFLVSLVELFLEDMPLRFQELQNAVEQMDLEMLQAVAHAIKGVSANLSGIALSTLASEMEKNAEQKLPEAIVALLPKLMDEYELLTETFQSYIENQN